MVVMSSAGTGPINQTLLFYPLPSTSLNPLLEPSTHSTNSTPLPNGLIEFRLSKYGAESRAKGDKTTIQIEKQW